MKSFGMKWLVFPCLAVLACTGPNATDRDSGKSASAVTQANENPARAEGDSTPAESRSAPAEKTVAPENETAAPHPADVAEPTTASETAIAAPPMPSGARSSVAEPSIAEPSVAEPSPEEVATMARSVNSFALDLYARLRSEEGNLFFSPYSISTALAMTGAGARGDTARQMAQVLRLSVSGEGVQAAVDPSVHACFGALQTRLQESAAKSQAELVVANRLWAQEDFAILPAFTDALTRFYKSGIESLDFEKAAEAARQRINDWVSKETKGLIGDLLGPGSVTTLTRLVVTNAIYFKGTWLTQFKKRMTREHPFHVSPERQVGVMTMYCNGTFGYAATETVQVLELPYKEGALSMVIVLPREYDGLAAVEKDLDESRLNGWVSAQTPTSVQVFVPRFKLSETFGLSGTLKEMGMTDAFMPGQADFTGITERPELSISEVVHKAYVDVNEEGTEAAAATGVVMGVTSAMASPTVFKADHPFLFLIRDTATGAILFLGRVTNPAGK